MMDVQYLLICLPFPLMVHGGMAALHECMNA
jgi:hypothetical protein